MSEAPRRLRVLIADDDALFVEALVALLGTEPRLDVVGRAANGREAVALALRLRPDIVLMDLDMPVMDGIEATRALAATAVGACVLAVSGSESASRVREAQEAGAAGYVHKARAALELVPAIVRICGASAAEAAA